MKKTWITSDLHLSHRRILDFCPVSRPFETVEEMNSAIMNNWNSMIHPLDDVYILGDVAFCSGNEAADMLSLMHGKKYLVLGNHDKHLLKSEKFIKQFEWVKEYHTFKYDKKFIVLFHFPIFSWEKSHYGAYHLFGHLHDRKIDLKGRCKDVGLDTNFCRPYLLQEVLDELSSIKYNEMEELKKYFGGEDEQN